MAIDRKSVDTSNASACSNIEFDYETKGTCLAEAENIATSKFPPHFLFVPSEGGILNGSLRPYPQLSHVFSQIVPENSSLVFAFNHNREFREFFTELISKERSSIKDIFLRYGVQQIPSTHDSYQLSGGSFATVMLEYSQNHKWSISKLITLKEGQRDIDADVRLLDEAKFIATLPPSIARYFPRVYPEDISETATELGYKMEYCPYPTLAELVLSRHLNPEATIEQLANIYDTMFSKVYSCHADNFDQDDDYFERISRRIDRVLTTPDHIGARLKRLLREQSLTINGKPVKGFFPMFESLRSDEISKSLVIPPDYCVCHGDMILEDILVNPHNNDFKLIDPNRHSYSKYYDIAKTLLSLFSKYELFYFDAFSLNVDKYNKNDINIVFDDPEMTEIYQEMGEHFWAFLESNAHAFFKNDPQWRERLILLNGMQNISIVMFHLIQHKNEDRAIAFLLMGLQQVARYQEMIDNPENNTCN